MKEVILDWQTIKKELLFYVSITLIACVMGIASFCLLEALHFVTNIRSEHNVLLYFLPIIGVLTAVVYQTYGKGSEKGNNLIIESTYSETKVPLRMAIFTFIFTILTHLFGGSAGREGSAVQIGGVVSNKVANYFHLDEEKRQQMIHSGISAGFASIFGTPLAGAFFGMEMVYLGRMERMSLFPCLLAAYVANFVATSIGAQHTLYTIKAIPHFSLKVFFTVIVAAVFFGLFGKLFAVTVHFFKSFYKARIQNVVLRAFVSAAIVVAVIILFNGQKYEGLSLQLILDAFDGKVSFIDPIMKLLLTGLTLGAGFQGGEVTPLFDIGSTLGSSIGVLVDISPSFLAGLGMIAVFGSAANTPITTIMLGIDLFGSEALPYYVIVALISYIVSGHGGIYGSQIIVRAKNPLLKHHEGQQLGKVK